MFIVSICWNREKKSISISVSPMQFVQPIMPESNDALQFKIKKVNLTLETTWINVLLLFIFVVCHVFHVFDVFEF